MLRYYNILGYWFTGDQILGVCLILLQIIAVIIVYRIYREKEHNLGGYSMQYEVGEKVKIRKDLVSSHAYGGVYFAAGMKDYDTITIEEITRNNCYKAEENKYFWTDEMLNGLADEEVIQHEEK